MLLLQGIQEGLTRFFSRKALKQMSGIKDLLTMTKRERQGTIALLAVIALLLAVTLAMRTCRHEPAVETPQVEMQQFEAEVDSAAVTVPDKASKRHGHAPKRTGRPARHPKKSKPAPTHRPMDPVPAF